MKLNVCIFLIKDENVFDKFNEIWEKVSNIIKKEFNSELVYKENIKKLKKIKTKERFHCACAQVILIDSVYIKDKNYYPKVFLEKCNLITIEYKRYLLLIYF